MENKEHHTCYEKPCEEPIPCTEIDCRRPFERNRYFTGKFLRPCEFEVEQRYVQSLHQIQNRLGQGWGVAEGLGVDWGTEECGLWRIKVVAGIAIDSCGREVFLLEDTETCFVVAGKEKAEELAKAAADAAAKGDGGKEVHHPKYQVECLDGPRLLVLQYCEVETDFTKPLCPGPDKVADRVFERARLVLLSVDETAMALEETCWPWSIDMKPGDGVEDEYGNIQRLDSACQSANILHPSHCCWGVPLALLRPWDNPETPIKPNDFPGHIDPYGRRYLPGKHLTKIAQINWKHGGEHSIYHVADEAKGMGKKIVITLSNRIWEHRFKKEGEPQQVPSLLEVVYGSSQDDVDFLYPEGEKIEWSVDDKNRTTITFKIEEERLRPRGPRSLANSTVFIKLKCDSLRDCYGRAVDGDFVRGILPTGDGVEGGTFESWFTVDPHENTAK